MCMYCYMGEPQIGHLREIGIYDPPMHNPSNRTYCEKKGHLRDGNCHSFEKVGTPEKSEL